MSECKRPSFAVGIMDWVRYASFLEAEMAHKLLLLSVSEKAHFKTIGENAALRELLQSAESFLYHTFYETGYTEFIDYKKRGKELYSKLKDSLLSLRTND